MPPYVIPITDHITRTIEERMPRWARTIAITIIDTRETLYIVMTNELYLGTITEEGMMGTHVMIDSCAIQKVEVIMDSSRILEVDEVIK
jgi:hypothetical protein